MFSQKYKSFCSIYFLKLAFTSGIFDYIKDWLSSPFVIFIIFCRVFIKWLHRDPLVSFANIWSQALRETFIPRALEEAEIVKQL